MTGRQNGAKDPLPAMRLMHARPFVNGRAAPSEEREEEMMYSHCVQCMSVDYANFCITVIMCMLLGTQTKEGSLFVLLSLVLIVCN